MTDMNRMAAFASHGSTDASGPGTVYLVGAGPGDPGLLTLRGVECLQRADLVLYDYLANPSLVEHAREGAELVRLGHHRDGRSLTPDEITAAMVAAALEGRTVVRLKGGDSSIFARGSDEAAALRENGIPFEIVPGVTSGLAVAAYAEIPITHHEDASAVALVTGHERDGKDTAHLDYAALARFPGTLVFYMGVRKAAEWSRALIDNGRSPDTPVAIVRWCSRAGQRTVRCTLDTVVEAVAASAIQPPALFVVGEVVSRSPCVSWFEQRPLFGTTVLVAGSAGTAARVRQRLSDRGAEVLSQPVIRVADPHDTSPLDDALDKLGSYGWVVFTSPNAVDRTIRRLFDRGRDVRDLKGPALVALGSGTAAALGRFNIRPDLVPDRYRPMDLARSIVAAAERRVLLVGGANRTTLAGALRATGAHVDTVMAYEMVDAASPDPDVARALDDGDVDCVAVTSAVTARALVRIYGPALRSARIASISPFTSDALRRLGYETDGEASPATVEGLVAAVGRLSHARAPALAPGRKESVLACAGR